MAEESSVKPTALPSADEVKRRRKPRVNVNEEHEKSLTAMERAALWTTENVGTMGFSLIILFWTVAWMGWNYTAQKVNLPGVFDRPWEFAIWLFIPNLIQIHLMPLIMVGQNLQARHSEMRAEGEFQVTQQTEYEMETVPRYLQTICEHLEGLDQRVHRL